MRWLIASSVKFRLLVLLIAAGVTVAGFVGLRGAPVDVLPEFSPPTVQIQTEALGLSAVEVEQLITVPLEADFLAGLPWLDDMTSESVPGLSSVTLTFDPGTNVLRARQMVQERLSQAFVLPNVSTPPVMIQPLSSTNRVMMIGLSAKHVSPIEMSVLTRWIVKPRLLGVPGVANVAVWGNRDRQLQVRVDPAKLRRLGVDLDQVITTTANALWVSPLTFVEANTPGTGGFVETPNQRLGIQHISPITKAADLARVAIEGTSGDRAGAAAGGGRLRLGDVATVVEDHQPLIGDALVAGGPGLMLVVEKLPGANTLEVTRGVEEALAALRPGLAGIDINTHVYRPATFIDRALHNLTVVATVAAVLLLLVLFGFLFDWRKTVVSLVAVVVSLAATALVLTLTHTSLNTMVLAGIVLAAVFVIADAVDDVHNIAWRLREHHRPDGQEPDRPEPGRRAVVVAAVLEGRGPMAYATLITLLAAAPILFLPDLSGMFFRPLALTFVVAVAASALVALTVTPAIAMLLLREDPPARRGSPLLAGARRGYDRLLHRLLSRPTVAYATAGLVLIAGVAVALLAPLGGRSVIPALQDRNLLIHFDSAAGTSTTEMIRLSERMGAALRAIPGVSGIGAHVGRAITADEVVNANSGDIWITIDPAADYRATRDRIGAVLRSYPGIRGQLRTYPESRIGALLDPSSDDVVVRIYGEDFAVLDAKAREVARALSSVPHLTGIRVTPLPVQPTVQVRVDLARAQRVGLKPGDVRRASAALVSGVQAGSLFEEQKVFDVVVWGVPSTRDSLDGIRGLLLDTPSGGQVRLDDVADVRIAPSPSLIRHDSVSRFIDVTAHVRGGDIDSITRDIDADLAKITFPAEYHAELTGDYSERQGNRTRAIVLYLAALIVVYLLIQAAVASWRLAALLLATVPVAVAGGLLVGLIAGITAATTTVGVIAVAGFAARTGLALVGRVRQGERAEGRALDRDLVTRAARDRLAPVLTTFVAVTAVLVPLLVLGGEGSEIARPIALVVLGGVGTAAAVGLLIVPALAARFGAGSDDEPAPAAGAAGLTEDRP